MAGKFKLNETTQKRIIEALSVGSTYALACLYAGISDQTLINWMKRGKKAKEGDPFRVFYEAVRAAEGKAAIGWLAKIEKAASDGEWQAAAWKLERRYPQSYGRKVMELQGKEGEPLFKGYIGFDTEKV